MDILNRNFNDKEAEATYDILCQFNEDVLEKMLTNMGIAIAPRMQIINALKQKPDSVLYEPKQESPTETSKSRKHSATDFNPTDIHLGNVIGHGQFGAVFKGTIEHYGSFVSMYIHYL
jgi:hypothetical protein